MEASKSTFRPSDEVLEEIRRAFRELRPRMIEFADENARLNPRSLRDQLSDEEVEQFINAYESLFMEALDGGHKVRDMILDTALEPIMATGQTALDFVRSNILSAVLMAHRLLPLVREDLRDDAARWLAVFQAEYAHDSARKAMEIEARRG